MKTYEGDVEIKKDNEMEWAGKFAEFFAKQQ